MLIVPAFEIIISTSKDEMLLENDEGVRCCPISHAEQEGIEDLGKMFATGYSDDDVDNDTDESPDESRDLDCPVSEDLS